MGDDPYYAGPPQGFDRERGRRRTVGIVLSVLVIPLLVAAALGASGSGSSSQTKGCAADDPGCTPATTTAPTLPGTTEPVPTPGDPTPPGDGGPLPPTIIVPPPPPASPSPPPPAPTTTNGGNTNPPPSPSPPPPSPTPPPPGPPPYNGPPKLVRSDGGAALFPLPNAAAGKTVSRCVTITYKGNPAARVRLYGIRSGTGLEQYIDLRVVRGTSTKATNGSCSGFHADSTNYLGLGAGVVFDDLLSTFPTSFAGAPDEPTQADRERWTNGEKHTYRFVVRLSSDNAAQGLTVNQDFTWEARGF
jgi:hypothetical protein